MHLNQSASSPTPIFFGGWIYRLFKTYVQRTPKSFRKGPWSGKVDITQCRSMGIIHEMGDGTVRFQATQGDVWNPKEALVLHADPNRPPPQYQGYQAGSSLKEVVFIISKVYMIFCMKTYCAPATHTIWLATPLPRSERGSATSPLCRLTSHTSRSIWCTEKRKTIRTRIWTERRYWRWCDDGCGIPG
ncbi:hypothetical protein Hanom_Chr04g00338521 [Helianthus anomalus]